MRWTALVVVILAALAVSAQDSYFPKGVLSSNARSDLFRSDWYSKHLKALEEPSLLELAKKRTQQSYRFVWLRTFHHPVIVRLDIPVDGIGELTVKVAGGAGGYEPGKLIENSSHQLTREQTNLFLAKVNKAGFWEMSSYLENAEVGGSDGSRWIIEGIKDGKYHVVDRWTPGKGSVRELGLTLAFELGKLQGA